MSLRPCLAALFVFLAVISCSPKAPHIDSIDPKIVKAGEQLAILGSGFGSEKDESYVTIAGVSPTNSSYLSWRENLIVIKTPELGESGLVHVYVHGKKSNSALFVNQTSLPVQTNEFETSPAPRIVSVTPHAGPIGSLISIAGSNFGNARGQVLFPWEGGNFSSVSMDARNREYITPSESEFGYELWNDREIRVRIPDGAASGNIEVRVSHGNSRPFFIDISARPGSKVFNDKRSYSFKFSANFKVKEAGGNNALYVWMPKPAESAAQRNIELLSRNAQPYADDSPAAGIFQLANLRPGQDTHIDLAYKVDVYAVETNIRPQSIKQEDETPAKAAFTKSSPLIPCDNPLIKSHASVLIGRERNPYIKAQRIYEWFIGERIVGSESDAAQDIPNSAVEALQARRADSYTAALLYCALARACGVPCIPVAGVLINRNRQTFKHYWAEFWVDGFGWIPVDIGLGSGAAPVDFQTRTDRASYYFGNIDSQRIAFSRGQAFFPQMDTAGRTISHTRSYAFQNIWEEASGELEAYSSLWSDIIITGIYSQ